MHFNHIYKICFKACSEVLKFNCHLVHVSLLLSTSVLNDSSLILVCVRFPELLLPTLYSIGAAMKTTSLILLLSTHIICVTSLYTHTIAVTTRAV